MALDDTARTPAPIDTRHLIQAAKWPKSEFYPWHVIVLLLCFCKKANSLAIEESVWIGPIRHVLPLGRVSDSNTQHVSRR